MVRLALTLWFAVTTLLGPGVCCCSFASSLGTATPAGSNGDPAPAAKPVKSCCHNEAPPCGEHGKQNPEPGKPSKCPCEHGKQVKTLPPGGHANAELAAQLKLLDTLFVCFLAPSPLGLDTIISAPAGPTPAAAKLAGRDLLAAYSLLRC